jgi:hypothetical protein
LERVGPRRRSPSPVEGASRLTPWSARVLCRVDVPACLFCPDLRMPIPQAAFPRSLDVVLEVPDGASWSRLASDRPARRAFSGGTMAMLDFGAAIWCLTQGRLIRHFRLGSNREDGSRTPRALDRVLQGLETDQRDRSVFWNLFWYQFGISERPSAMQYRLATGSCRMLIMLCPRASICNKTRALS